MGAFSTQSAIVHPPQFRRTTLGATGKLWLRSSFFHSLCEVICTSCEFSVEVRPPFHQILTMIKINFDFGLPTALVGRTIRMLLKLKNSKLYARGCFFPEVAGKKFTIVCHYIRIAQYRNVPAPVSVLDQEAGAIRLLKCSFTLETPVIVSQHSQAVADTQTCSFRANYCILLYSTLIHFLQSYILKKPVVRLEMDCSSP